MLIGRPLKPRQLSFFLRLDEQNRISRPPRPTRSADPVNVGFGVVREIIVDHMTDSLNIQTASCNISRNNYIDSPRFQLANCSLTLILSDISVERRSDHTSLDQVF